MGKDYDFWMDEASKFWAKNFPNTERAGPTSFCRVAIPINNKAIIKAMEELIKTDEHSGY